MNLAQLRSLTRTLAMWLAAITSLAFALCRFLPSGQPGGYNIVDDAWIQMLHFAFAERLQFGRDIVFTFGPWGFLYGGYHPATHWISVVMWLGLAIVFWWAAWRVITHFCKNPLIAWVWMMAVIGLASITPFLYMDARLTAWPLLLLLLHFSVEKRAFTITQAMLVVSLALLSLVKHSIFTIAVVTVLIITADNVFRQRRFPWIVLAFAGGIFFFWVAAGQGLSWFGRYLGGASEIVSGYTEAMMWPQPTDKVDIVRFWEVAIAVCALVGYFACKQHRLFGLLPLLGFAFIVFAAFKHGYVRHDGHEIPATNLLLLAALLWLPVAWCIVWQRRRWLAPVVLLPLIFATPLASLSLKRYYANNSLFSVLAQQLSVQNLFAPAKRLLEDKQRSLRSYDAYAAGLRAGAFPNLDMHGSADVYPVSQTLAMPPGLTCRPRPIFQSYSAYTPRLAEINAAHLRSDRAADHILFDVWTIDGRFAAQDDSLSWPELLTRYDTTGMAGKYILMEKSVTPRQYQLTPISETMVAFDQAIDVPSMTGGPIWVTIDIRPSFWGNIMAMLYRPPRVSLTVFSRSGQAHGGRLLPVEARAGFLLSPVIENGQSFLALESTNWQQELAGLEVTSARVSSGDQRQVASRYQSPPVLLRFYRLDFQRQELQRVRALPVTSETPPHQLSSVPGGVTTMFEGRKGTQKGEFDSPTGIAVDNNGNILVADTANGRIEKFSPTGAFISSIGTKGSGHGQFADPNGIAVDWDGNVYVAEVGTHRVQKLASDGTFVAEWKGPEPGFYGPRRIAVDTAGSIYVVDQGHTRIVKFSADGRMLIVWGSKGTGDGQFDDPTSVAVDSTSGKVYVADPHNKRIQVFDSNGKFLTKWLIPEWGRPAGFEDLAVDSKMGRLYASSANMDAVLILDLNGRRIGSLRPKPPDKLEGPSALALTGRKLYVLNMAGNRVSVIDL
jgi:DNA-binding beta-propeller fold protein YncE